MAVSVGIFRLHDLAPELHYVKEERKRAARNK